MAQINTLKGVYGFGSSPNRKHMIMALFGVFLGLNSSREGSNMIRKA